MRAMGFSERQTPTVLYGAVAVVAIMLIAHLFYPGIDTALLIVSAVGALPLSVRALGDILRRSITIDVFNLVAIGVSFASGEVSSAGFIVLMILCADILEWHTSKRTQDAIASLLKLKPLQARRCLGGSCELVSLEALQVGDVIVTKTGEQIGVDGIILQGRALVNEALVTGESLPVEKTVGSRVIMSTVVDTGFLKVRATHVGAESTLERMAALMRSAAQHKSNPERLADRFAGAFLPVVIGIGVIVYVATKDLTMTSAIFLVACADDMAVAIPLAMTASLGFAAQRGVVIKGGAWLATLAKAQTVVLDKTGTLTYGNFRLESIEKLRSIIDDELWRMIAVAEKYSEHPIGRALAALAQQRVGAVDDPEEVIVRTGTGIVVRHHSSVVGVGDATLLDELSATNANEAREMFRRMAQTALGTLVVVVKDAAAIAIISLADVPRPEAAASLSRLRRGGIQEIIMFTGDDDRVARRVGSQMGIGDVRARMKPEDKLKQLANLTRRPVVMVGDGVNDAPALAQADVGVAMGKSGTAIASEAADVIILNDDLSKLHEMIILGKRTMSVIHWDIGLWAVSNIVGFALVLTGVAGPAFAAFYNFITDFFPLINSSRLFRS